MLDTWEDKTAKPLRAAGVGQTKDGYEAERRGDDGRGWGGGGGGGGRSGGSSRSLGE